jgi:hypothetical protein
MGRLFKSVAAGLATGIAIGAVSRLLERFDNACRACELVEEIEQIMAEGRRPALPGFILTDQMRQHRLFEAIVELEGLLAYLPRGYYDYARQAIVRANDFIYAPFGGAPEARRFAVSN